MVTPVPEPPESRDARLLAASFSAGGEAVVDELVVVVLPPEVEAEEIRLLDPSKPP